MPFPACDRAPDADDARTARRVKLWLAYADRLAEARDVDGALEVLAVACRLDPASTDAHGRMAGLLHRLGRDAEALAHLRAAARHAPDPAKWTRRIQRILGSGLSARDRGELHQAVSRLREGRPELAEPLFRRLVEARPRCIPAWIGLKGTLQAMGRPEEAAEVAGRLISSWPRRRTAVVAAAARPLSRRGLVFDPREPLPIRSRDEVLTRVRTPSELRKTPDSYMVLDPGGAVRRLQPVIPLDEDGGDDIVVLHRTAEAFVAGLDNALLAGRGAVITAAGQVVADLLGPHDLAKYGARATEGGLAFLPERFADGACPVQVFDVPALLMAGPTDLSFGDWINQFPPRLALAEAAKLRCPVVVRQDAPAKYVEMLAALGVDADRLLFHDVRGVSIFPRLYVPSWPMAARRKPMRGWLDIYQRAAAGAPPPSERPRLYLSRRDIASRSLVNEDEIIDIFVRRGFDIVCPERLDLRQTLDLFAAPSIVAGPYGSNLRNLVFCREKPAGFFLLPPYPERFHNGSALFFGEAGVRFGYVRGRAAPKPGDADLRPNVSAWTVDPAETAARLDRFIAALAGSRADGL